MPTEKMHENENAFDCILLVSFGGPEGQDEVVPFLENVLRGKNVPEERMLEVAEHYRHFGGVSPINEQNRQLIHALELELGRVGIELPIYWGNRNWHPMLPETLRQMQADGKKHALAFFTSMFSCYSGCRQYRENIAAARTEVGENAPVVEKLRKAFNHPLFIEAQAELTQAAFHEISGERHDGAKLLFTAHSIPMSMADNCNYVLQLKEASRLIAESVGQEEWELVYQSRSGPPHQPWLEPDVCERIEQLAAEGVKDVVLVPLGFISDHMEVLFDLDTEAKQVCERLGVRFSRASSAGTHPLFVQMIRELIQERLSGSNARSSIGRLPASHDVCPEDCCLNPRVSTGRPRG